MEQRRRSLQRHAAPQQLFALADVRPKPGAYPAPVEDTTFFFSSEGMLLTSPLADGQHRAVASVLSVRRRSPPKRPRRCWTRGPRGGAPKVVEVITASTYHVLERVAERLSDGPVFLVRDAAHSRSPAGGQGMNTGIQNARQPGLEAPCRAHRAGP